MNTKIVKTQMKKNGILMQLENEARFCDIYVVTAEEACGYTIYEFSTLLPDEDVGVTPIWVVVPGKDDNKLFRKALMFLKKNKISYLYLDDEEMWDDERNDPKWRHVGNQFIDVKATYVAELDLDAFFTKTWTSFDWVYTHDCELLLFRHEKDALDRLRRSVEKEIGTSWDNYLPNVGPDEKMEPDSVELNGHSWQVWKAVVH